MLNLSEKTKYPEPYDMITSQDHPVWFLYPERTVFDYNDFYIHTSNICRYNGALDWKLLGHLALCSKLVEHDTTILPSQKTIQKGFAAAHDLHEIYCTDVVHGLKKHIPQYVEIENRFEIVLHNTLGLTWSFKNHDYVKHIDQRALVLEMTMLGHPAAKVIQAQYGGPPTEQELKAWYWTAAHANIPTVLWQEVFDSIEDAIADIKTLTEFPEEEVYADY